MIAVAQSQSARPRRGSLIELHPPAETDQPSRPLFAVRQPAPLPVLELPTVGSLPLAASNTALEAAAGTDSADLLELEAVTAVLSTEAKRALAPDAQPSSDSFTGPPGGTALAPQQSLSLPQAQQEHLRLPERASPSPSSSQPARPLAGGPFSDAPVRLVRWSAGWLARWLGPTEHCRGAQSEDDLDRRSVVSGVSGVSHGTTVRSVRARLVERT